MNSVRNNPTTSRKQYSSLYKSSNKNSNKNIETKHIPTIPLWWLSMSADNYVTENESWCTRVCMKQLPVFLYTEIYFKWYVHVLPCTYMKYKVYKMPYQTSESNYNSVTKFTTTTNILFWEQTNIYYWWCLIVFHSNTFSLFHKEHKTLLCMLKLEVILF